MKAKFDDINEQLHKEAMTDSIAAARERLATLIYKTKPFLTGPQAKEIADAILAAYPQIAPPQDVVSGARAIAHAVLPGSEITGCMTGTHTEECNNTTTEIAAFATAHAAREREACAKECERVRDGGTVPAGAYACAEDMCAAAIRARKT